MMEEEGREREREKKRERERERERERRRRRRRRKRGENLCVPPFGNGKGEKTRMIKEKRR